MVFAAWYGRSPRSARTASSASFVRTSSLASNESYAACGSPSPWIVQQRVIRRRLGGQDVEIGTSQPPLLQRNDQGGCVDDRTARRVDQIGVRLHLRQHRRADDQARAVLHTS